MKMDSFNLIALLAATLSKGNDGKTVIVVEKWHILCEKNE